MRKFSQLFEPKNVDNKFQMVHNGTCFPNDTNKHIDYVIKYKQKEKIDDIEEKRIEKRNRFFTPLENQGFLIYHLKDDTTNEEDLPEKEHYSNFYALLNCSEFLELPELSEQDLILTRIRSLQVDYIFNNLILNDEYSDSEADDQVEHDILKTLKEKVSEATIKKIKTKLQNIKNAYDEIEHLQSETRGLHFMLKEGYFENAFILHDETNYKRHEKHILNSEFFNENNESQNNCIRESRRLSYQSPPNIDYRLNLNENWARFNNIFKFQPLKEIKDYFGERIEFYFCWVELIITSLWIPSVIGLIFFIIGLVFS